MTVPRFGRTDRRRLVASSIIGGAAILFTGKPSSIGAEAARSSSRLAQETSTDVPMFRVNPAHTGVMPGPGPENPKGKAKWQVNTGGSVFGMPVVVGGLVIFSSRDAYLRAVDADTGDLRWDFGTGDGGLFSPEQFSSPAAAEGLVFTGSNAANLYALDLTSGSVRWQFVAEGVVASPPTVSERVVYFGSYQSFSDGSYLHSVNIVDGTERWRFGTSYPNDFAIASPAVADNVVFAGLGDLHALDLSNGAELWRFTADGPISSSPAVVDGVVYVGCADGNLYAVDAKLGTELWRYAVGGAVASSPAVGDGFIFVGGDDGTMHALDARDGTVRWEFKTGGGIYSSPSIVGEDMYFGSTDETLYVVNAQTGKEHWRFATNGPIYSSPAVIGGVAYIGGEDLYAIGGTVIQAPELSVGGTARVVQYTTLRGSPSPTSVARAELVQDTVVTITGEAESASGSVWWPVTVNDSGEMGWVDASTLEPLTSGPAA